MAMNEVRTLGNTGEEVSRPETVEREPGLDLRVVKTRRAIKAAFRELFATTEYSKITVSAVARLACVNRKTFYAHYASIDELLASVMEDAIRLMSRDAVLEEEEGGAAPALLAFTRSALHEIDKLMPFEESIMHGVPASNLLHMIKEPLARTFIEVRRARGLPDYPDAGYHVAWYIGGLLSAYGEWCMSPEPRATLDELADLIYRMTVDGVPKLD